MSETAVVAILVALISTVGVKVIEWILSKIRTKDQQIEAIKVQLQKDKDKLEGELHALSDDVEKWKREYYDLRDEKVKLETELRVALSQIERYENDINRR